MRHVSCVTPILLMASVALFTIPARTAARLRSGVLVYEIDKKGEGANLGGKNPTEELHIWFKGTYFRSETRLGNVVTGITINRPDGCYLIYPNRREAIKLPEGGIAGTKGVPGLERTTHNVSQKVASEKIGRFETDVFALRTDAQIRLGTRRRWMSREFPDLMVKEVVKRPDR